MRVFRRSTPLLLILLAGLLALAACDDDDTPIVPVYEIGVLEGTVTSAGEGVAVRIRARAISGMAPEYETYWTRSDSLGHYRLELPTGNFRLNLEWSGSENQYEFNLPDTLRVTQEGLRRDFKLGRVEIDIAMPGELEGQGFRLELKNSSIYGWTNILHVSEGRIRYVNPIVPPGEFIVDLYRSSFGHIYLPGTRDKDQATLFQVPAENPLLLEKDFSDRYATISGTLSGSWEQSDFRGTQITAFSADFKRIGNAGSDEDGDFVLETFFPEPVKINIRSGLVEQWIGGQDFLSAREFELGPEVHLTGLVHEANGVVIRLQGPGETIYHRSTMHIMDGTGEEIGNTSAYESSTTIHNLADGRYHFYVEGICRDASWAPQWYGGSGDFAGATPVDLSGGELRELVFDLTEGGRLEGEALGPAGERLPAVRYYLYDLEGRQLCWNSADFPGDPMLFTGLADGTYLLAASRSYGFRWYHPGTEDPELATRFIVADHGSVGGIEWNLPPEEEEESR